METLVAFGFNDSMAALIPTGVLTVRTSPAVADAVVDADTNLISILLSLNIFRNNYSKEYIYVWNM